MANTNMPRGLIPVRYRSGAPYAGQANVYFVPASYATALFIGDPVIPVTASADANGIPVVQRATAAGGAFLIGSVVGVVAHGDPPIAQTRDNPVYRPASVAQYILVADDPDLMFEIQEDGIGGAMPVGASSRNVDLIAGTGSTVSGYSGFLADSSTLAVTATLQLRLYRPAERADNEPGNTLAKWLVSINLHSVRNTTGI